MGIEPLSPAPGATPDEIVRNFIDAAASARPGHRVAREYLTPEAARTWYPEESETTVISQDFATVTRESGAVEVTANPVGTVDPWGVFTVAPLGTFTRQFALEQVDDEWRITDPPDGLIILEPDFQRLYEETPVYFFDPTYQRLVPDPRYVIAGEGLPTAIVDRLLAGPSGYLSAGVRNALAGARLRSNVSLDGQAAIVDLTGLPAEPSPMLAQASAQLVWTLSRLRNVSIRSVEVRIDGEPVDIADVPDTQTTEHWTAFDPEAVPLGTVGHYVTGGGVHTVASGEAIPGPAGTGQYGLVAATVSIDPASGDPSYLVGVQPQGAVPPCWPARTPAS
ncbi:GerMN domain-containing protein [Blastococcus brunescens]|uniref:GerMN domain-containing protein n=1 Tax=Blastococcus brunescens TaxID=1564165 RepID=A0ABZ1AZH4_9ACTN|nr:GerMN domain-containing protein [Blastococcus sp. BMG 8361]WRL62881.1 GerMN domain-containing protein [Blastococcus sp. BMG 8361]